MKKRNFFIIALIFFNIAADQISKAMVRIYVDPGSRTEIIGEKLQLLNVENSGAFLGLGSDYNEAIKFIFLLVLPAIVLVAVLFYLFRSNELDRMSTIGFSCVVGGGIANLYDRMLYGQVTDFLFMDFGGPLKTGVFNIADLAITTGMVLLLISTFKQKKRVNR
jgi:signal peptidase II